MASQALSNKPTPVFGLADGNSFFASCERVFRPDLAKVPIVVLSSNDGCVIARSYDAKPYVKMGAPYFQIKDVLRQHGIQAFMHRNFKMPVHPADAMTEASCLQSDA
nr:DNA-directed DNA polymerase [Pseudomonas amygdali]